MPHSPVAMPMTDHHGMASLVVGDWSYHPPAQPSVEGHGEPISHGPPRYTPSQDLPREEVEPVRVGLGRGTSDANPDFTNLDIGSSRNGPGENPHYTGDGFHPNRGFAIEATGSSRNGPGENHHYTGDGFHPNRGFAEEATGPRRDSR